MEKSDPSFEVRLRKYQRLTLTLFYPPLLSLFATASAYFYSGYSYYLSYASTRFLMLYCVEAHRGAFSAVYFLPLLAALALVALFAYLTLRSSKGKLGALLSGSILYLADAVYGSLLIIPGFYGAMRLDVYLLNLILHLAFLVLYGFALANYAKLVRPSGKPRRNP
jgi:hypothetical protein